MDFIKKNEWVNICLDKPISKAIYYNIIIKGGQHSDKNWVTIKSKAINQYMEMFKLPN